MYGAEVEGLSGLHAHAYTDRYSLLSHRDTIAHLCNAIELSTAPFLSFQMLGYMVVFEPKTLTVIPTFFKQLPNILRKRKIIKSRRKMTDAEMDHWLSEKE